MELKIDQIKKVYTIRDEFYPLVEKNLPTNERKLFRYIGQYRDKYISILSSPYLLYYPVFSKEDSNILYTTTGINQDDLMKSISDVKLPDGIKSKPNFKPDQTTILLMMKYYIDTKQDEKLQILYYYMAYSFYWSLFKKYFRKFLPREETMVYTVNNLSNKFILKQTGSVDGLLFYAIKETVDVYRDRIGRCSDPELYYVLDAIKTRVNNYVNKICNEYMHNYEKNEVHFKSNEMGEDSNALMNNSVSNQTEMLAQEYTTKFFSEAPRIDLINQAAKLKVKGVSTSELRSTLMLLCNTQKIDEVESFYESIFHLFLSDNSIQHKDVKSLSFIGAMEAIYKKGNSNDKNIITIKKLMDKWLKEGSATYRVSNRQATLNDFRKAIFYYFILLAASNK